MKKQFQILATTFITVAFISCSKEKIETPQTNLQAEEVTGISNPGIVLNPLNIGLIGRFEFDGNLKEMTNKLPNWISTANRAIYTADRKGNAGKAIRFNEAYGLYLLGVPLDTNMSVSVWVKNDLFPIDYKVPFVEIGRGLNFYQEENKYMATSWNGIAPQYVWSGAIDNNWHHIASTRDKTSMKFYVDGILVGSSPTPAGSNVDPLITDYNVGYGFNAIYRYWKGNMDDLRIYKRSLSAVEISKLASL